MRFAIILQHANMAYHVQRAYYTQKILLPSLKVHSRSELVPIYSLFYRATIQLQRTNMENWF